MSKRFALLLALLLGSAAVRASDPLDRYIDWRYHPPKMQIRDVEGLKQRIQDGKLHLHLHDFLELVLKNSTDIDLTRLDVYTAADQIIAAKAPFDPTLTLGFNTLRSVEPVSFFEFGGIGTSGTGSTPGTGLTGVSQITLPETISSLSENSSVTYNELLPTGQTISSSFFATRSSGYGLPYPTLFGTLNITIMQPLLRNRTNIENRAPLQIARTQLVISSDASQATIANAIADAATQYWTAIQARDSIHVQQQNLELARKSYEHDKLALDLGALAKLDIYQSETQVAERNRDLVSAEYQYKSALDGLRRLIGADLTPEMRSIDIVLEDDSSALPPKSVILPFEQALAKALQTRPESDAATRATAVDELNARVARDALKPELDLTAQGGATGPGTNQISINSATGLPTSNPYPGLGPTLGQVLAFNYPSYGFGLQLTFPFRNSAARASLSDALVNRARDLYRQRQTKQQITLEVRQAIDSLELAGASIEAATKARDLAQKNVEAEQQKYQLGTITAFEVLDSQNRLANTESALLDAYVNYQRAYIAYQRATWTLLDGLGMVIETPKVR